MYDAETWFLWDEHAIYGNNNNNNNKKLAVFSSQPQNKKQDKDFLYNIITLISLTKIAALYNA